MTASLARFQDRFAEALFAQELDAADEIGTLMRQPGFAVYRNTVMKGCVDALQANYPSVARLTGEEWFRAAAAIFTRKHGPRESRMLYYGEKFPEFLAYFEPAAQLPYLPDVALLDRFWTEAHAARDELPLDPTVISRLPPEAIGDAVLYPHAAARWAWFTAQPSYTIWKRNREALEDDGKIEWRDEGALLVRPRGVVEWIALDVASCAFLDACAAGRPLADAAAAALDVQKDTDLARLFAKLLAAGAFGRIARSNKT